MPESVTKPNTDLASLVPPLVVIVRHLMQTMDKIGWTAQIVEAQRSYKRQLHLYRIGRTIQTDRKPVTWTLHSKHLKGEAVDLCSKHTGYQDPRFFVHLAAIAHRLGLNTLAHDPCHIELP